MNNVTMIIIIAVMVAMSAYFSATETAFSSLNRIKMKNLAEKGNKRAILALKLSENYDQLLSSILIGNNIVNIASASIATLVFTAWLGDRGVSLSTVVMTIIVLIFGEISPKSIAKDMPESIAMLSAPVMNFFCIILTPVNFLFTQWKKLLNKMLHVENDNGITEEEILTMVKEAQNDGGINEQEGELIQSAIEFNDVEVTDVFTPRIDVVAVENTSSSEEIFDVLMNSGYSRIPVFEEDIDHVIGIINQKDFYNEVIREGKKIEEIIKPVIYITPTMKISRLMRTFQQKQSHMALIVDEYGGTMGIITLEDILEELVGEIWDEHEEIVQEIRQVSENEFLVLGSTNVEKLFDELDLEEEFDVVSVNGWVTGELDRIPRKGDSFTYKNLTVTVEATTERRVLEVRIRVADPDGDSANLENGKGIANGN